jgi:Flp pilus assembly protein TadG
MLDILRRRTSNLRQQGERGSILILVVLSALIIIGSAGLAVDVGRMYATKAELSRTVDAAALAGVLEFNGQASGLTAAGDKAEAYLLENKVGNATLAVTKSVAPATCVMSAPSAACVVADGAQSKLSISARKQTRLYFLPIFGINTASVSAKAISGFNDQTLDAVMVIDATASMSGAPLTNAKTAADNFKDTLLGTSPSGNVYVGVAPLRGCYRPSPGSNADCVYNTYLAGTTSVQGLTSNSTQLDNAISAVSSGGMSATNVCTGLGKGYEVLNSAAGYPAGHQSSPNNRRFLVLLSDGDNVYFGQTPGVYVPGPPASPNSYTVPTSGGTTYACAPPNTCTGWGTPCQNGTYPGSSVVVATEGFESNTWTGGTGWAGNWIPNGGSPAIVTTPTGSPMQAGSDHLRLRSNDTIYRAINLSGVTSAELSYFWKRNSFESGDNVFVQCSTSTSGPWTELRNWNATGSTSYAQDTVSLPTVCRNATVYIRFQGSMGDTSDQFYVDSITVTNLDVERDGYLDGQDGQNYTSCDETPKARERQLDVATLNLANAIKAQNVEIFVVSFSACPNADGLTIHNAPGSTTCNSQANPITSPPASGRVGDTTTETTANTRLAKCIASSSPNSNDHFWYATDAAQLPAIFTTIAAQIAHRLVE